MKKLVLLFFVLAVSQSAICQFVPFDNIQSNLGYDKAIIFDMNTSPSLSKQYRIMSVNDKGNAILNFSNKVHSSWTTSMTIRNNRIGIGTTAPEENLHVGGLLRIDVANGNDNSSPGIVGSSNDDFLFGGNYLNSNGLGFYTSSFEPTNPIYNTYLSADNNLDLFTEGENRLRITSNGNVGIGTTSPGDKLTVDGNISNESVKLNNQYGDISMRRFGAGDTEFKRALVSNYDGTSGHSELLINYLGDFETGTKVLGSQLIVGGNLGVGTNNPDSRLTVKGKIHAEEVKVDLNVPADYVFEMYYDGVSKLKSNYIMPSLEEVAAFTKENHHLPGIPSADKIKEEGLHLKEMTNLLLQKIEELTLYTIEQEKRIKQLELKIKDQE